LPYAPREHLEGALAAVRSVDAAAVARRHAGQVAERLREARVRALRQWLRTQRHGG
jgi:hypothetical protein